MKIPAKSLTEVINLVLQVLTREIGSADMGNYTEE